MQEIKELFPSLAMFEIPSNKFGIHFGLLNQTSTIEV